MSDDIHELDRLRAELDKADSQLLRAAVARQDLVERIGAYKARQGRSLFDRSREQKVVKGAMEQAQKLGLDPETAGQLMQVLLEASHRRQEARVSPSGTEVASKQIALVGGAGQMGQMLAAHFLGRGHQVQILDLGDGLDHAQHVQRADVTMIAVPMHAAAQVVRALGPHVRPDALLCDINSLKRDICQVMESHCEGEVLGTHPMFGPTVKSLRRQKVVLCQVRPGPLCKWMETELGHLGLDIIHAEAEHHDRMMAAVQVLVHFHTLVMGEALRRTGIGVRESLRFTSPIYRLELAVVGRLFTQDPDLYAEIEMSNPYAAEVQRHFHEAASDLHGMVSSQNKDAFRDTFHEVAEYFGDFGPEAMALSDELIEALVRKV